MRYEYKIVAINDGKYHTGALLDELGAQGWELVAILPAGKYIGEYETAYFKRQTLNIEETKTFIPFRNEEAKISAELTELCGDLICPKEDSK